MSMMNDVVYLGWVEYRDDFPIVVFPHNATTHAPSGITSSTVMLYRYSGSGSTFDYISTLTPLQPITVPGQRQAALMRVPSIILLLD